MKRTIYYMIIGYLLLGTGCSDWLSVNPKDKVEQKEMFSDENGFKNALIGNYIMLKDSKLYGKTLTMEFCENLAQHWKTDPQATDGYTAAYDYKNAEVERLIEDIYGKFYNTIVNINNLLDYVDNGVLTSDMHDLIKGEALAMRAFCHLDILRLFGPIPGEQTKDRILSYVRTVSKDYHEVNTWEEYVGYLEKDLNEAEGLLKEVEEKLSTYNTSEFLLPGEEEEFQQLLKEKQTLRKKTKNIIKVDELEVLLHNGMDEMQVDFIKDDISNKMSETKLGLRELFNEINLLKGKIKNVADFVKANYESLHQSDSPVFAILNAIYI